MNSDQKYESPFLTDDIDEALDDASEDPDPIEYDADDAVPPVDEKAGGDIDDIDDDDTAKDDDITEIVDEDIPAEKNHMIETRYIVAKEKRLTSERMTSFELYRMIGDRSIHLNNGAKAYVDTAGCINSEQIAYMEIRAGKLPFSVVRRVSEHVVEVWDVREMTIPHLPRYESYLR